MRRDARGAMRDAGDAGCAGHLESLKDEGLHDAELVRVGAASAHPLCAESGGVCRRGYYPALCRTFESSSNLY